MLTDKPGAVDPRKLQLYLTGFLHAKNARIFVGELWQLLISAQAEPSGFPSELIEQKKVWCAFSFFLASYLNSFILSFTHLVATTGGNAQGRRSS